MAEAGEGSVSLNGVEPNACHQAALFLPIDFRGAEVLVKLAEGRWRVTAGPPLSYRTRKHVDSYDTSSLGVPQGSVITGSDEGDGWVRVDRVEVHHEALFDVIDTNHDGVVSQSEYEAAVHARIVVPIAAATQAVADEPTVDDLQAAVLQEEVAATRLRLEAKDAEFAAERSAVQRLCEEVRNTAEVARNCRDRSDSELGIIVGDLEAEKVDHLAARQAMDQSIVELQASLDSLTNVSNDVSAAHFEEAHTSVKDDIEVVKREHLAAWQQRERKINELNQRSDRLETMAAFRQPSGNNQISAAPSPSWGSVFTTPISSRPQTPSHQHSATAGSPSHSMLGSIKAQAQWLPNLQMTPQESSVQPVQRAPLSGRSSICSSTIGLVRSPVRTPVPSWRPVPVGHTVDRFTGAMMPPEPLARGAPSMMQSGGKVSLSSAASSIPSMSPAMSPMLAPSGGRSPRTGAPRW